MSKERAVVFVDGMSFEEMVKFYENDPIAFDLWRMFVLRREILKIPISRRNRLREKLEKYEFRKTFEEIVEMLRSDIEIFEMFRTYILWAEIHKSPLATQILLSRVLNGYEMRMSRFGYGVARYNAVVAHLLDFQLPKLTDALHGEITPVKKEKSNVIPLFGKNKPSP